MKIRKLIPKQKEISSWLGGISFLFRQTAFYFSIVNLVLITHVFYVTSPAVQKFFGSYWMFLGILGLGLLGLMAFEYAIMVPSIMRFQQEQAYKSKRSPLYEKTVKIEKDIEKLRKQLEKIEKRGRK